MPKPTGPIVEGPLGFRLPERMARSLEAALKTAPGAYRRKAAVSSEFSLDAGSRKVVSMITTDDVDRDGEVVLPDGIDLAGYNGTVTFAHSYDTLPIGRNLWIKPKKTPAGNGLIAATEYAKKPDGWDGEWLPDAVLALQQQGICTGFSIGFIPKSIRKATPDELKARPEWKGRDIIDQCSLLEYAACSIPCNSNAELVAVSKGFGAQPADVLAAAKSLRETIVIKTDGPHDYGCAMCAMPPHVADMCLSMGQKIADEHLADDGRETEPHVTLKYGLHAGVTADDVQKALDGVGPVMMTIGKSTHFAGEDKDVVHLPVTGDGLQPIHDALSALPNSDSHPEYQPHVTLAYVAAGRGRDYDGMDDADGLSVACDRCSFNDADGNGTDFLLTGKKAVVVGTRTKDAASANEGNDAAGGYATPTETAGSTMPSCPKCGTAEHMSRQTVRGESESPASYRCSKCETDYRVKDDGSMEEMDDAVPTPAKSALNPRCNALSLARKGLIDYDGETATDAPADFIAAQSRYPVLSDGRVSAKLIARTIAAATAAGDTAVASKAKAIADEIARHPKPVPTFVRPETIKRAQAAKRVDLKRRLAAAAVEQQKNEMARLLGCP